MIHIFESGRIVYADSLMRPEDYEISIAVDKLPAIPHIEGKRGYPYADLSTGEIVIEYRDAGEEEPIPPEPAPEVTLKELNEKIDLAIGGLIDIYETILIK